MKPIVFLWADLEGVLQLDCSCFCHPIELNIGEALVLAGSLNATDIEKFGSNLPGPHPHYVSLFFPNLPLRRALFKLVKQMTNKDERPILASSSGSVFFIVYETPKDPDGNPFECMSGSVVFAKFAPKDLVEELMANAKSIESTFQASLGYVQPPVPPLSSSVSSSRVPSVELNSPRSLHDSTVSPSRQHKRKRNQGSRLGRQKLAVGLTYKDLERGRRSIFSGPFSPFFAIGTILDSMASQKCRKMEIDGLLGSEVELTSLAITIEGVAFYAAELLDAFKRPRCPPLESGELSSLLLIALSRLCSIFVLVSRRWSSVRLRDGTTGKKVFWMITLGQLHAGGADENEQVDFWQVTSFETLDRFIDELEEMCAAKSVPLNEILSAVDALNRLGSVSSSKLLLYDLARQKVKGGEQGDAAGRAQQELYHVMKECGKHTFGDLLLSGVAPSRNRVHSQWGRSSNSFTMCGAFGDSRSLADFLSYYYFEYQQGGVPKLSLNSQPLTSMMGRMVEDHLRENPSWQTGPGGVQVIVFPVSTHTTVTVVDRFLYHRNRLLSADSRVVEKRNAQVGLASPARPPVALVAVLYCGRTTVVNEEVRAIMDGDDYFTVEIDDFIDKQIEAYLAGSSPVDDSHTAVAETE